MNKTNALTLEHVGAMPAPTWHFLKMNEAIVEIPEGLDIAPDVTVDAPWSAQAASDEFENALLEAQEAWEAEHPALTAEEQARIEEARAAEADVTYGGTAQSAYQIGADALEEARSLSMAFECGLGDEATAALRYFAGEPAVIVADANKSVSARVVVRAVDGAASVGAIDVVAYENSIVLREDLTTESLSYIYLCRKHINALAEKKERNLFSLQPISDDMLAFWGAVAERCQAQVLVTPKTNEN